MMELALILLTYFTLAIASMNNPVAMVGILFLSSTLVSASSYVSIGSCWFPLIFYLLFIGGILVLFMILSSVAPNEKMSVESLPKGGLFIIPAIYLSFSGLTVTSCTTNNAKEILSTEYSMSAMLFLIALFFLAFLKIIERKDSCLRSATL